MVGAVPPAPDNITLVEDPTYPPTDLWIRNPRRCLAEVAATEHHQIVWDVGLLSKFGMDPGKIAEMYLPGRDWKVMVIDSLKGEAAILDPEHTTTNSPAKVHPVWEYGEKMNKLESMLDDNELVVITQVPTSVSSLGRQFFLAADELQQEYPDCAIHLHATYSYKTMFGLNFKSVDAEPFSDVSHKKVVLPNGRIVTIDRANEYVAWISLLGFLPVHLKDRSKAVQYQIKSLQWASHYYKDNVKFRNVGFKVATGNFSAGPPDSPFRPFKVPKTTSVMFKFAPKFEGDKFLCDVCTLQDICRFYREGMVCGVKKSEGAQLSEMFGSRDSNKIIDGLGKLLQVETSRLQTGLRQEESTDTLNPNVTRLVNTLFDRAEKLARLIDPSLNVKTRVDVHQFGNRLANTPQELMSQVVGELTARGIQADRITPEMVLEFIGITDTTVREQAMRALAIETTATDE